MAIIRIPDRILRVSVLCKPALLHRSNLSEWLALFNHLKEKKYISFCEKVILFLSWQFTAVAFQPEPKLFSVLKPVGDILRS